MLKSARTVAFGIVLSSVVGCASVNSVSLTPIPSQRNQQVKANVSRVIFLGFNFDNDYVDPLVESLKSQCPNGVVSGILTKDETISYFIVFKKQITATGYCNISAKATAKNGGPRKPSSVPSVNEDMGLE